MKLPNFVNAYADSSSKIGHDFSNKGIQILKLSKNYFLQKKCAPKRVFSNEKKSGRFE
jgi:hypothetical protein